MPCYIYKVTFQHKLKKKISRGREKDFFRRNGCGFYFVQQVNVYILIKLQRNRVTKQVSAKNVLVLFGITLLQDTFSEQQKISNLHVFLYFIKTEC